MDWDIIPEIENSYFDSNINAFFNVDSECHERIIRNIGIRIHDLEVLLPGKSSLAGLGRPYLQIFKIFLFYFAIGIIGWFLDKRKTVKRSYNGSNSLVLINSASRINRFEGITDKVFGAYETIELIVYNENIFKYWNKNNLLLINPKLIGFETSKKIFTYLFNYREHFLKNLVKSGIITDRKTLLAVDRYIVKMIIHHDWALEQSEKLVRKYAGTIFIFDQDGDNKALFLAAFLNRNNINTILIQHGIMTEPKYYHPICKYIFCCSERESNLLMESGVARAKIFIYGAPFQTLPKANELKTVEELKVKALVLASSDSILMNSNIGTIKNSAELKNIDKKALRLRPADYEFEKEIWRKQLSEFSVRDNVNIFEEIYNADIIITFSYDVLIKCLYLKKKVIVCIDASIIDSKDFSFFKDIPFLRIATDSHSLDEHLKVLIPDEGGAADEEISDSVLEYYFGTQDLEKIQKNISNNFNEIRCRQNIKNTLEK